MLVRTLSALLLAPPLVLLLLRGSAFHLYLLLLPVVGLLIYEWQRMREPLQIPPLGWMVLSGCLVLSARIPGQPGPLAAELGVVFFVLFAVGIRGFRPGRPVLTDIALRFLGVVYCSLPLALLLEVRQLDQGGRLLCGFLFIIWGTDIGAYVTGRLFGRRKLAPHISPGKSWAGLWGGLFLGSVSGVAAVVGFSLAFTLPAAIFLAIVVSLAGQVGDLVESVLKREAGVKDAGRLIPGHGGLLDRLDSLLFAVPFFYLFLYLYGLNGKMGATLLGG